MQTILQVTEAAVVRLLLMDKCRKQVVLSQQPENSSWMLPYSLLPDHQTPPKQFILIPTTYWF